VKEKEVEFKAAENLYQSHILNYIAILPEVEAFKIAVDTNREVKKIPGPWVITVDYKARGKTKTHFIVVKVSERLDKKNKRKPIFYFFHPSQA
jgi:hypothetical protein